jgi:hypothetical protein
MSRVLDTPKHGQRSARVLNAGWVRRSSSQPVADPAGAEAACCNSALARTALTRETQGSIASPTPPWSAALKADAIRCYHCKATLVPGARFLFGRVRRPARITR